MHLYEISEQYHEALTALTEDEFDQQTIDDTLEAIQGEFEEKGKNVAAFSQNIHSDIEVIDKRIKELQARKKVLLNRQTSLKNYLHKNMEATGITKIESPYMTVSIRKCPPSVVIDDEDLIPDEFIEIKRTVNKTKIKQAEGCPGAHIETGKTTVQIKT